MKIFKIEHGYTVIKDIDGSLESMQNEVGGMLTTAPHFDELTERGIDIYADDEGLLKPNPEPTLFVTNKDDLTKVDAVLVGALIFVGTDKEGRSVSLTQSQIDYISEHLFEVTYAAADGRSGRAFTFAFEE